MTMQVMDIIKIKRKKYFLYDSPIEEYIDSQSKVKLSMLTTACWRGYKADWKIKHGKLYITDLKGCLGYDEKIKANIFVDLTAFFPDAEIENEIFADWFTGMLKYISTSSNAYFNPFDQEWKGLKIVKGVVVEEYNSLLEFDKKRLSL